MSRSLLSDMAYGEFMRRRAMQPEQLRGVCRFALASGLAVAAIAANAASLAAQAWGQNGVTVHELLNASVDPFQVINDNGQVVGWNNGAVAAVFNLDGSSTTLGTLGGSNSYGFGINGNGDVVGQSGTADNVGTHAFLSTPGSGVQDLGTLGGSNSVAFRLNASGQVVGYSYTAGDAALHAFIAGPGTGMIDLGTLGGSSSYAYGINNTGQVVGSSVTSGGVTHAFVATAGAGMRDLGTLGGSFSAAFDINSGGQIVGESTTSSGVTHAFLTTDGTSMEDLGTLAGGVSSYAYGISSTGEVVGRSKGPDKVFQAALWESDGSSSSAYSLADVVNASAGNSGWVFNDALGISDNGEFIVAQGYNTDTEYSGLVVLQADAPDPPNLTITPEPASLALLATGLLGVLGIAAGARRRRYA